MNRTKIQHGGPNGSGVGISATNRRRGLIMNQDLRERLQIGVIAVLIAAFVMAIAVIAGAESWA